MEIMKKGDDGRQHRRQSKDFNDITNLQSDMSVADLKWDKIFHKWDDPENCTQKKLIKGCLICNLIEKGESVEHLKSGG